MASKALLRPIDVAEQLKCSTKRVYKLIDRGKIKIVKLGEKSIRIKEEDLSNFIDGLSEKPVI